ncbi:PQQ-dependent sugar dehydrogenase [Marinimicrobium alkaliphilum]|uniref:PQQ-dependent sugar dehydrogenase n=1 Tax=Marinimicrobium alkaliphilum TaxID=2202654 RepID=UPI0018E0C05A|nr:PQQ-dependent sugar dehydrogenase [Marinimicrobium alkaliphilum]
MPLSRPWVHLPVAFLMALALGAVLGSLIQTQFNLIGLGAMGADIGLGLRLEVSARDLVNFAPLYAAILGASLLVSLALAALISRWLPSRSFAPLCALAAACGLWLTFKLVDALAPMPTLIAATRSVGGTLALVASAALAGWVFARILDSGWFRPRETSAAPILALLFAGALFAAPEPLHADDRFDIQTLAEGLNHPWSVAFLPDGRALITERVGRLRLLDADGALAPEPVAGLPDDLFISGQAGLKAILLARDFERSRRLYLSYACGNRRANHLCILQARLGEEGLESVREILRTQPAKTGDAHYGGRMVWLPDDTLVVTYGDGFDYREQAQNPASHIGSILRINNDGTVPGNNPFVGRPGIAPETYSYGHRNPQGLVYDPEQALLVSHEHGPKGGDEINVIRPGLNYGWPLVSHGLDYTGAVITPFTERQGVQPPLLEWTPSIAPSGMTRYEGELFPEWQGQFLLGALAHKRVYRVSVTADEAREEEMLFEHLNERIRDVATGPDGALYLLTDSANGRLLRVTPAE